MDQITKNALISAVIVGLMKKGLTIDEAIDAFFGPGTYMKLATDVYHKLRGE